MEKTDWTILSTRPLSEDLLNEAAAKGFHIECLSFIDTEPIQSDKVAQRIRKVAARSGTVAFTSMNAVDVVRQHIDQKPDWRIYAIGNTTKQLVEQHLGPVSGTAEYGGDLADAIIRNGETAVTFFCGDIRRDELPGKLQDAGIELNEVVVYRTISLPQKLTKAYNGILFYSPSAVHAFFEENGLPESTILFAIGHTTAAALNTYTQNRIYVADSPSKEGLVRDMMDYFSNQNQIEHDSTEK
ncbi:uroporphyrinogen-III synthase [Pseudocnuella soli]|uniref:uroporphyrinogen-III synthase n=1 Tax=Pseudocnuella soli TaxID=2502779 RepID=UPI0014042A98|nr:uroporphyrinogen-III synthase [Pseudocnuella soli]